MLVSNQLKIGDIIAAKLITGEEIIGKVSQENESQSNRSSFDNDLILDNVLRLMPVQNGAQFIPYSPIAKTDEPLRFRSEHIVTRYSLNDELEKEYRRVTSGIAPATQEEISSFRNLNQGGK